MQKPNFKEFKNLIDAIKRTDNAFDNMFLDSGKQKSTIKAICGRITAEYAKDALFNVSVEELKNARAGIRVSALQEAGFITLGDIARSTDYQLQTIEGIGEKQTEAIRNIVTEFANSMSSRFTIQLNDNDIANPQSDSVALITEMYRYMKCEEIRSESKLPAKNLKIFITGVENTKVITNNFKWLFSGTNLKVQTLMVADDVYNYSQSAFFQRVLGLIDTYSRALGLSPQEAVNAFRTNNADFYALLESLDIGTGHKPFVYDSIPAQLAQEVENTVLDLGSFRGNLRAYQAFGAKYAIYCRKVLLGDEMGLGKTIQAIAVMAHLFATSVEKIHFLVICPASVIVNWDREIKKFSRVPTFILHGQTINDGLEKWRETGGAAITNYESMGKIVSSIDNRMKLALLAVDEAHYIKNPDAQRTQNIRKLDNESERIMMMTGTPLENRVDEMCNLIEFVRPDMVKDIRNMAHLSNLPEFSQALAPVYLRRTRKQVLTELPPIDEKQMWCEMTESDKEGYVQAIVSQNFSSMRRVSFLQDDISNSSKISRLLEICEEARDEGRKIVVFSFFRDTIEKVSFALGRKCAGVINGDTRMEMRQALIDNFSLGSSGDVLVCQIQAGGVGLNIQSASIVIFCEPQIKPSLTWQALSRVYRMGQSRNVLVYHLLCEGTIDEEMIRILEEKKLEFKNFADGSVVAEAYDNIMDKDWIKKAIEAENQKYLPMVI